MLLMRHYHIITVVALELPLHLMSPNPTRMIVTSSSRHCHASLIRFLVRCCSLCFPHLAVHHPALFVVATYGERQSLQWLGLECIQSYDPSKYHCYIET